VSRHHDQIKNDPRYKAWRAGVLERAGHACEACGSDSDLTADHVTPLDAGGEPFDPDNGRCLCRPCNSRKGNRVNIRTNYYSTRYLTHL